VLEDYRTAVESSLRALGGQEHYVTGARLLSEVQKQASSVGDFRSELNEAKLKFSKYLQQYLPDLQVHVRGAADMMVGFPGARFETPEAPGEFRADAYSAFSKGSPQAFVYDASTDEFTTRSADGVPVPRFDRADSIAERQRFIESVVADSQIKTTLTESLSQEKPFTAFRHALEATGLTNTWHAFKNRQIRASIEKWAIDNGVAVRESWFRSTPKIDSRATMMKLISVMTEDEIRSLRIPFRAVESYLRNRG
jgi:hypothetical protein